MEIRQFCHTDAGMVAALFHLSINRAALGQYSEQECRAWSPELRSDEYWIARLAQTRAWVADESGVIAGFINLKPSRLVDGRLQGEIDCLFTHPDFLGRGVGSRLFSVLQDTALETGVARLTVEASYLARALFEKQGFTTHSRNEHPRAGQTLVNFSMSKVLGRE